jgi:hypothetical protein
MNASTSTLVPATVSETVTRIASASNSGVSVKPVTASKLAFLPLSLNSSLKHKVVTLLATLNHQIDVVPAVLKTIEHELLTCVQAEPTLIQLVGEALWQGANTTMVVKQVASMALLRSGQVGRTWLATQLAQDTVVQEDKWLIDFLRHQFSL